MTTGIENKKTNRVMKKKTIKAWAIVFENLRGEIEIGYPLYHSKKEAKITAKKESFVNKIRKIEIKILK